jgi:cytoskeletal protein CcmA (bactofilin family)
MLEIRRETDARRTRQPKTLAKPHPFSTPNESGLNHSAAATAVALEPMTTRAASARPVLVRTTHELKESQTRVPVIVGEAHYRGTLPIDGMITGQLGSGSCLNVRQRSRPQTENEPELCGELTFNGMVRVNRHIAGSVYSKKGTLIVDAAARVDADIEVAVAVIGGCVTGDIVAHERVELGARAKIYGNIWTRSIEIRDGAIFEGVCRRIEEECSSI